MGVLRRLAQWSPWRRERPRPSTHDWAAPTGDLSTGITGSPLEGPSLRPAAPQRAEARYSLDRDIGEVALGYHLIARSVSLTDENLFFEYAFVPELTEEGHEQVWPNMFYDADVSPPDWNWVGAEGDVQYARPPLQARHAWFDFFPPEFEWDEHFDRRGEPDSDYLRNRIARLTFDLKTGEARIEK